MDIQHVIEEIHAEIKKRKITGKNADYIPELKKVNPKLLAISIYTINGEEYNVGDFDEEVAIESVSKVFSLALALKTIGTSKVSKMIGNLKALLLLTLIWIVICIAAYFVYSINAFYVIAAVVGSVMGGIQSLSRSTFAKMIPSNSADNASYFSFYEFSEKVAVAIGTFSFGFIEHMMRNMNGEISMRYSVLSLVVFFVIGSILLYKIRNEKIED
jgi:MFS-type transporter involved in bile tolerance (Atg22 family)